MTPHSLRMVDSRDVSPELFEFLQEACREGTAERSYEDTESLGEEIDDKSVPMHCSYSRSIHYRRICKIGLDIGEDSAEISLKIKGGKEYGNWR